VYQQRYQSTHKTVVTKKKPTVLTSHVSGIIHKTGSIDRSLFLSSHRYIWHAVPTSAAFSVKTSPHMQMAAIIFLRHYTDTTRQLCTSDAVSDVHNI